MLEPSAVAGPEGLAVLAFRQGTPYQGEDLIYDATAPENFLVRCSRNGAGPTPGMCLYVRRIGEADVDGALPARLAGRLACRSPAISSG